MASKLIQQLTRQIPTLIDTDGTAFEDTIIQARLFALGSAATWYIAEFDATNGIAFGYAYLGDPVCAEWGYIDINELAELKFSSTPRVEFDQHFTPCRFADVLRSEPHIAP